MLINSREPISSPPSMLIRRQDLSTSASPELTTSQLNNLTPNSELSPLLPFEYAEIPYMPAKAYNAPEAFDWARFQQVSSLPSEHYDYQQQASSVPRSDWALYYSNGPYAQYPNTATPPPPQAKVNSHRRNLSNSTIASLNSTSSSQPFPHQTYLDPNTFGGYQQHYPTPTHTPTQDTFMDRSYSRRGRQVANVDQTATLNRNMNSATMGDVDQAVFQTSRPMPQYPVEYPNTPSTINGDDGERKYNGNNFGETDDMILYPMNDYSYMWDLAAMRNVTTLNRATPDVQQQQDFYNPQTTSAPLQNTSAPANPSLLSPNRISDRLQAAHQARSSRSPAESKREPSPFQPGSRFATTYDQYAPIQQQSVGGIVGQRQQQQNEAARQELRQHQQKNTVSNEPTISPQEAYKDNFVDPAENSSLALFPQQSESQQQLFDNYGEQPIYGPLNGGHQIPSTTFGFQAPIMPASTHYAPQGDFKFAPLQHQQSVGSNEGAPGDVPARLVRMETSKSEPEPESSQEAEVERPASTTADRGTYTCTYQNCTQRFANTALLQKHKREAHRSTANHTTQARSKSPHDGETPASPPRDSQAGPHRCSRINPSTGKPCNTVFSRPYDLTRHEDTIHARRTKVHCQYCTEEKTFSRADALTRHMRVVHPTIEFPGKHRKRNAD